MKIIKAESKVTIGFNKSRIETIEVSTTIFDKTLRPGLNALSTTWFD